MLRFTDNIIGQMTLGCNLNCKYCFQGHDKFSKKQMSFEEFKKALNAVLYYRCVLGKRTNEVEWHFHGGEVTLLPWSELKKMILYIEEKQKVFPGLTWGIQTNGTLLNEEICQFFNSRNKVIGISFDGFEANDRMSPENNRKFIEHLKELHTFFRTKMSFLMVLSKKNMKTWISDARELLTFAESVGVNLICTGEDNKELALTGDEIWEYWFKPVLKSFLTSNPIRERDVEIALEKIVSQLCFNVTGLEYNKTGCFDRICGMYSNMTAITPELKVRPCDKFMEDGKYLNLRIEEDLDTPDFLGLQTAKRTISHYEKMFKIEKELHCDSCPARFACSGDCQSYNLSEYGENRIPKEYCVAFKKLYKFIEENIIEILSNNKIKIANEADAVNPWFQNMVNESDYQIVYNLNERSVFLKEK